MPLTQDFKETVRARAQRDPAFREALLREAIETLQTTPPASRAPLLEKEGETP